jgi:transcriptional regulator with XRE-family HTH domain
MMITAPQCRSARTLLNWSVSKLASASTVSESDIDDFELERRLPNAAILDTIRRALEALGVVFLADNDVRLRACSLRSPVIADGAAAAARQPGISDRQVDEFVSPRRFSRSPRSSGRRHRRSARVRAGFRAAHRA